MIIKNEQKLFAPFNKLTILYRINKIKKDLKKLKTLNYANFITKRSKLKQCNLIFKLKTFNIKSYKKMLK